MLAKIAFLMACFYLGATTLGRAADQFPADTDFVGKAERSGNQEIADARDALASSKGPAILAVAKQILDDDNVASRRLAALSVEKGWPTPTLDPPTTMSSYSDQRDVVSQIQALQDALTLYGQEAANGADTDLQAFARDQGRAWCVSSNCICGRSIDYADDHRSSLRARSRGRLRLAANVGVAVGIPGVLLAGPMIACFKIVCEHVDVLKPTGVLIGNGSSLPSRNAS